MVDNFLLEKNSDSKSALFVLQNKSFFFVLLYFVLFCFLFGLVYFTIIFPLGYQSVAIVKIRSHKFPFKWDDNCSCCLRFPVCTKRLDNKLSPASGAYRDSVDHVMREKEQCASILSMLLGNNDH